jgi:hypothetical protein
MHMHVYTHAYVYVYVYMYIYLYIYIYIYIFICVYIYIYIYTHTYLSRCGLELLHTKFPAMFAMYRNELLCRLVSDQWYLRDDAVNEWCASV